MNYQGLSNKPQQRPRVVIDSSPHFEGPYNLKVDKNFALNVWRKTEVGRKASSKWNCMENILDWNIWILENIALLRGFRLSPGLNKADVSTIPQEAHITWKTVYCWGGVTTSRSQGLSNKPRSRHIGLDGPLEAFHATTKSIDMSLWKEISACRGQIAFKLEVQ